MVGLYRQRLHGVIAQPCAQALTQLAPGHGLRRPGIEQVACGGHERRQLLGLQAQCAAASGQGEGLHAIARDLEQQCGIAFGCQQADGQHAGRQQVMLEMQVEALHAAIARAQEGGQVQQQATQREQQGLAGFDLVFEFDARIEPVRWLVVAQWRGGQPTQCIQLLQYLGAKRRARLSRGSSSTAPSVRSPERPSTVTASLGRPQRGNGSCASAAGSCCASMPRPSWTLASTRAACG